MSVSVVKIVGRGLSSSLLKCTNHKAFTLAEVLTTLMVIGVVAALTIPNLVSSYRKTQIETSIKKGYSTLANAVTMAKTEHGSVKTIVEEINSLSMDSYEKSNYFTKRFLLPYMKYVKFYEANKSGHKDLNVSKLHYMEKEDENMYLINRSHHPIIILSDNTAISVLLWGADAIPYFIIDSNGFKNPNKLGHDAFIFTLRENEAKISEYLKCGPQGYTAEYDWTFSCAGEGQSCACVLMMNGWKFPEDYPIKKF